MGEIADAMLSGELCAMCGVPLCDDCAEMDIPMYCSKECARNQLVPKRDIGSRICENQFNETFADHLDEIKRD